MATECSTMLSSQWLVLQHSLSLPHSPQFNTEGYCTGCLAVVPLLALFHLLLRVVLSLHSRIIESVSLFQSAILTKRSNSLLAAHFLLHNNMHFASICLHLPQIEEVTDAYFCRRMCQSKIEWEAKYRSINGLQHCCL